MMAKATGQRRRKQASRERAGRRLPRGRVTVFPNWCKGCDLCVAFCPGEVLAMGEHGWVVVAHPERCRGCHWCELHCPDFAIFVSDVENEDENEDESAGQTEGEHGEEHAATEVRADQEDGA